MRYNGLKSLTCVAALLAVSAGGKSTPSEALSHLERTSGCFPAFQPDTAAALKRITSVFLEDERGIDGVSSAMLLVDTSAQSGGDHLLRLVEQRLGTSISVDILRDVDRVTGSLTVDAAARLSGAIEQAAKPRVVAIHGLHAVPLHDVGRLNFLLRALDTSHPPALPATNGSRSELPLGSAMFIVPFSVPQHLAWASALPEGSSGAVSIRSAAAEWAASMRAASRPRDVKPDAVMSYLRGLWKAMGSAAAASTSTAADSSNGAAAEAAPADASAASLNAAAGPRSMTSEALVGRLRQGVLLVLPEALAEHGKPGQQHWQERAEANSQCDPTSGSKPGRTDVKKAAGKTAGGGIKSKGASPAASAAQALATAKGLLAKLEAKSAKSPTVYWAVRVAGFVIGIVGLHRLLLLLLLLLRVTAPSAHVPAAPSVPAVPATDPPAPKQSHAPAAAAVAGHVASAAAHHKHRPSHAAAAPVAATAAAVAGAPRKAPAAGAQGEREQERETAASAASVDEIDLRSDVDDDSGDVDGEDGGDGKQPHARGSGRGHGHGRGYAGEAADASATPAPSSSSIAQRTRHRQQREEAPGSAGSAGSAGSVDGGSQGDDAHERGVAGKKRQGGRRRAASLSKSKSH